MQSRSNLDQNFIPLNPPKTVSIQLWCAHHKICKIWCNAFNHQQQYLNYLLWDARATNNKDCKQLILGLKHAEETQQCIALVCHILHPSTLGRLMYLLIPTEPDRLEWIRVTDMEQMEDHLLEHSCLHFWLVHGTPFMQPLLADLLGFNGLTPFGKHILHGNPIPTDLDLDPANCQLLTHQGSLLPSNEQPMHPLEFEPLMQGFWKWPECITTSPLGQHLGIYKSLLKDMPPNDPPLDLPQCTLLILCTSYTGFCDLPCTTLMFFSNGKWCGICIWRKSQVTHKLIYSAHFICLKLTTISYSSGTHPRDSWLRLNATTSFKKSGRQPSRL